MARKRRARRPDPRLARMMPAEPGWKWRSLPVWIALTGGFVLGWYVNMLGVGQQADGIPFYIFFVVLFGFSLGLSRVVRWRTERWVAARRARATLAEERPARGAKKPQTPG
jgi:hypothetical protein